jgi:APA family basic amino acid/polyamine antiporter
MAAKLRRTLGLSHLVFYGVSSMVGAGIYSVIGAAAGEAGTHLWLSFVLAAVAAFIAVFSYAELSALFPNAGAEYQYLREAFPGQRFLAFMGGYLVMLNACATAAAVSVAFGGYLDVFINVPVMATAFGLLAVCTVINIAGIRESALVTIALAILEVAGLLLMIGIGFDSGAMDNSFKTPPKLSDVSGIFSASALIFFVYIGFQDVAGLSEETLKPRKTVPRALLISLVATSIVYVLVAVSVIAVSSPAQLSSSASPLTTAVTSAAGWAGKPLALAALFATASTALIALVSLSRVLFDMARHHEMPAVFARVLPRQKTPWVAALGLFAVSCLFLPLGGVKILASVSSLGVLLVFAIVQLAVIRLRYLRPDVDRPFRVPLSLGRMPVIPVLGVVICAALMTRYDARVYGVMGAALAAGIFLYLLHNKWRRKAGSVS